MCAQIPDCHRLQETALRTLSEVQVFQVWEVFFENFLPILDFGPSKSLPHNDLWGMPFLLR